MLNSLTASVEQVSVVLAKSVLALPDCLQLNCLSIFSLSTKVNHIQSFEPINSIFLGLSSIGGNSLVERVNKLSRPRDLLEGHAVRDIPEAGQAKFSR